MTDISIVIRSKNEAKWIKECINRIRKQKITAEIILIDNRSEDATVEIAKHLEVDQIYNIEDYRPGKALNLGIQKAKGKYVVALSAHCLPSTESWLEKLKESLFFENKTQKTNVVAGYGRQLPFNSTSNLNKRDLFNTFGLESRIQSKDFFFHNANSIVLKDFMEEFPYDEEVTNVEDRLWAEKIIRLGYNISYSAEATVFHHHGLNHGNEDERLRRVNSIIEPLYNSFEKQKERELEGNSQFSAATFLVVYIDYSEIDKSKIMEFKKSIENMNGFFNIIFLTNQELEVENWFNRLQIVDVEIKDLVHLIKETCAKSSFNKFEYDYVLFVNNKALNNLENIQILWNKTKDQFLDLGTTGNRNLGNFWLEENGDYMPLNTLLNLSKSRIPLYEVNYGAGTFISTCSLFNETVFEGINGIYEIN